MRKLQRLLEGKKTYCFALLVGLVAMAKYLGYLNEGQEGLLLSLFGASGVAALRSSVARKL